MMNSEMRVIRMAVAGVVLSSLSCGAAYGQRPGGGLSPTPPSVNGTQQQSGTPGIPSATQSPRGAAQIPGMDSDGPDMTGKMQEQQAKTRNTERQKRLELDTEKLLSLATELKEQVDKTDKNILSVDVIKKADEIEKLAKSVKDRMKG